MRIIGISGNPLSISNTDCMVQTVLNASGITSEFIKLSTVNGGFHDLEEKLRISEALIIGSYSFHGYFDNFTKAFLERFRPVFLNRNSFGRGGKPAVVITSGIGGNFLINQANSRISDVLTSEGIEISGKLIIEDNPECMVCGLNKTYRKDYFPDMPEEERRVKRNLVCHVKNQSEIWRKAQALGQGIAQRLKAEVPSEYWL